MSVFCVYTGFFYCLNWGDYMEIDYYAYHSGMKKWNSGLKVLFSVVTLLLVIILNSIRVSLFVFFTMSALTLLVGKIKKSVYIKLLLIPLTFLIISGFTIAVEFSFSEIGDYNFHIIFFNLCFTQKGIFIAIQVFFKALAGISCLYMLALSTPVNEIIVVMQRLHLPKLMGELMNLTYRYIFILLDSACKMQSAAKSRLGFDGFLVSCKSFAGIAGNLFLISLKKANAYYDAMLARGYEGSIEFLNEEYSVKAWQIAASIIYFVIIVLIALMEVI